MRRWTWSCCLPQKEQTVNLSKLPPRFLRASLLVPQEPVLQWVRPSHLPSTPISLFAVIFFLHACVARPASTSDPGLHACPTDALHEFSLAGHHAFPPSVAIVHPKEGKRFPTYFEEVWARFAHLWYAEVQTCLGATGSWPPVNCFSRARYSLMTISTSET